MVKNKKTISNKSNLNILLLGSQMETGGAQKVLFEQAQWFTIHGYSVSIVFLYDKEGLHTEWGEKYNLPIANLKAYKSKGSCLINQIRILQGMWRLYRFIKRNEFDIIETFTIHSNVIGLPIAWACKIPVRIATHHGYGANAPLWLEKLHGIIINSRISSKMVVVSDNIAQTVIKRDGIKADRIIVIPNGIQGFKQSKPEKIKAIQKELNIPDNSTLILSIGRLVPQKGMEILLDTACRVHAVNQQIHFVIAGDGPLKKNLLAQRDQLGLQEVVNFLGIRNDIPDLLSAADIFLMTSNLEGMSIALLEAMSLAKPIVITAVEGATQVIENKVNGILVPVGDTESISAAVLNLVDNEKLRNELGQAAYGQFVRNFTSDKSCSEYERVFLKFHKLSQ